MADIKQILQEQCYATIANYLEGEAFLDVGCASGHSTMRLSKLYPGKWHGLDFSEYAIARAKELFPTFPFYYAKNFDLLGCIKKKFDSTVCLETLEYIDEDWKLIQGTMRITKKVLAISTPCIPIDNPGCMRLYTKDSLSELLGANRKYNYEIIEDKPFLFAKVWHRKNEGD